MKFEYKFFNIRFGNDEDLQKLNEFGEEGWEVVAAAPTLLILKREKK